MSTLGETLRSLDERPVSETLTAVKHIVFRDEVGLLVFLWSLLFFTLTQRVDFFINDTFTIGNTLLSVLDGNFGVTTVVFGPESGASPGTYVGEDGVVGRNYGQVFVTIPVYLLLAGLTLLLDLHALLVGLWAILLFVCLSRTFRWTGFGDVRLAALLTLPLFVLNVVLVEPIEPRLTVYVALQVTTMVAAAFVGVATYQFAATVLPRNPAALVGILTTVATPVGMFATVPKRHSFSALFVVLGLLFLYRSHAAGTRWSRYRYKSLTYATVGGLAWIHSAEGAMLFVSLAIGDALGTLEFRPKEVAFSGAGLVVSFVPFFMTNLLVSGNPVEPPRALDKYRGDAFAAGVGGEAPGGETPGGETPGGETPGGETPGGETPGSSSPTTGSTIWQTFLSIVSAVYGLLLTAQRIAVFVADSAFLLANSVLSRIQYVNTVVLGDDRRIVKIFFRRGFHKRYPHYDASGVNLSLLESMPALGGAAAGALLPIRVRENVYSSLQNWTNSAYFPVDVAACVFVSVLTVLAVPNLPLYASYTVRYLHPVYPIFVYFLLRLPVVRSVFEKHTRVIATSYAATVVIGIPSYTAAIQWLAVVPGEAVQLYAIVAFPVGVLLGTLALFAAAVNASRSRMILAVVTGVAFGIFTAYLVVFTTVVYGTELNLLPVVELISEQLEYTS